MTSTAPATTISLRDGDFLNEGDATSIRALLFGAMLDMAEPIVKSYRSDLYHDALWISKWVNGPMYFYWVVRECGSSVGTGLEYAQHAAKSQDAVLYKVTLAKPRYTWEVTFEELSND